MLKRIKYFLSHSRFYYNHFNVPVNNCRFWFKDLSIYLKKIKAENDLPLYVFSDSAKFLSEAKTNGFNVFEGKLGHISYQSDNSTVLKTFTDFYAMSQASTVYRIVAGGMYNTTFSMYSAFSGEAVFKSITVG